MNPTTPHGTVGAGWEKFSCNFGSGVLLGDTIIEIQVNFDKTVALTGAYTAYFDDFLIEVNQDPNAVNEIASNNVFSVSRLATSDLLSLKMNVSGNYLIQVYDISGISLINKKSNNAAETIDLSTYKSGVYILNVTINNKKYYQKIVKT